MKRAVLLLVALGCNSLPARLEVCVPAQGCETVARFKDTRSCEFYKTFYTAHCNSMSDPGKITCDTSRPPTMYVASCVD